MVITATTGTSWTGQSYVLAATALPDQCPPAADRVNALCDLYSLNVNVPGNFWDSNTGSVTTSKLLPRLVLFPGPGLLSASTTPSKDF